MNIQVINSSNFKASKPLTPCIKEVRPLSERFLPLLDGPIDSFNSRSTETIRQSIESIARNFGRNVLIAENSEGLLINSGLITTLFRFEPEIDNSRALYKAFITNIKGNVIAEERGYQAGIKDIETNTPKAVSEFNILA